MTITPPTHNWLYYYNNYLSPVWGYVSKRMTEKESLWPSLKLSYALHAIDILHKMVAKGCVPSKPICNDIDEDLRRYLKGIQGNDPIKAPLTELLGLLQERSKTDNEKKLAELICNKRFEDCIVKCYSELRTKYQEKAGLIVTIAWGAFDWFAPSLGLPNYDPELGYRALRISSPALKPFKKAYWAIWELNDRAHDESSLPLTQKETQQLVKQLKPFIPLKPKKEETKALNELIEGFESSSIVISLLLLKQQLITVSNLISGLKDTHPFANDLYQTMEKLCKQSEDTANSNLSHKEAKEIAKSLKILRPFPIGNEEMEMLQSLYTALTDAKTPLQLKPLQGYIKIVYDAMTRINLENTGALELVVENIVKFGARYFKSWTSQIVPPTPQINEQVIGWTRPETAETISAQSVDNKKVTADQIVLLIKKSASRLAIGYLICHICQINPDQKEGNIVSKMIEESDPMARENQGMNNDFQFQQALERKINAPSIPWWRKGLAHFALKYAAPLISHYIQTFIGNVETVIVDWIHLPSASERLSTLHRGLILPIKDYIATFLKIYEREPRKLRQQNMPSSSWNPFEQRKMTKTRDIPFDIEQAIRDLQNDSTEDTYLPTVTHRFIERILSYIPSLHWTDKAQEQCQEKMSRSTHSLSKFLWWNASGFFSALGYIVSPLQRTINRSIKLFLSKALKSTLDAIIRKNTTNNTTIYHIKESLLKNIKRINQEERKKPTDLKLLKSASTSLEIETDIYLVIERFRELLKEHLHSYKVISYIREDYTNASWTETAIKESPLELIEPFIATQIIPLLQSLLDKNHLEETWLKCLVTINEALFKPQSKRDANIANQHTIDGELRQQLDILFMNKLKEIAHDLLNPQEVQNNVMMTYLLECQNSVKKLSSLNIKSLKNEEIHQTWISFQDEALQRQEGIKNAINEEARKEIRTFHAEFVKQSISLHENVNKLMRQDDAIKALELKLNRLEIFTQAIKTVINEEKPNETSLLTLKREFLGYELHEELKPLKNDLDSLHRQFNILANPKAAAQEILLRQFKEQARQFIIRLTDERTKKLDQPKEKLKTDISTSRVAIRQNLIDFNTWIEQKSKFNEVAVEHSRFTPILISITQFKSATDFLKLVYGKLATQALVFINKDYHNPFFIQYLLRALLELKA